MMRHTRHTSGGFTFVEIMIAVTLIAMLMAAVGVAVQASMSNYRQNEDMARAITTARQALARITTSLRTATDVSPYDPPGQCTVYRNDGDITYGFDDAADVLYLTDTNGAHVLCRNVTAITFTRMPATPDPARNVRISLTVTVGDCSQTVSSAAVIRRNL